MNLRAVDLNFLVVFEAMYQERNQSKAGKRLNMSQPAVSNSLNKLRSIFNDRLFVKTVEGMQPTPKAEKLAPLIHEVINQLKSIYSEFAEFQPKSSKQVFRLTMSDYSEFVILPNLINRLEKSAPKVQIKVHHTKLNDRHRFLSTGKLDLAIFSHYPQDFKQDKFNVQFSTTEDLYKQSLFDERVVVIARKNHPEIKGEISLKLFLKLQHAIIFLHKDTFPGDSVDQRLHELCKKRKIKFMTQRTSTLAEVISKTNLIGTMVERYAKSFSILHGLQVLELPFNMSTFQMTLYWHARVNHDPANIWLRNELIKACQSLC
ncbi:MAG: LysR family transcriptional regulator [Thermodesulfobacteriota bacterium]|nr:LysR family transcriptional regulator [Thermodesulfobacteriota bacterium]